MLRAGKSCDHSPCKFSVNPRRIKCKHGARISAILPVRPRQTGTFCRISQEQNRKSMTYCCLRSGVFFAGCGRAARHGNLGPRLAAPARLREPGLPGKEFGRPFPKRGVLWYNSCRRGVLSALCVAFFPSGITRTAQRLLCRSAICRYAWQNGGIPTAGAVGSHGKAGNRWHRQGAY